METEECTFEPNKERREQKKLKQLGASKTMSVSLFKNDKNQVELSSVIIQDPARDEEREFDTYDVSSIKQANYSLNQSQGSKKRPQELFE